MVADLCYNKTSPLVGSIMADAKRPLFLEERPVREVYERLLSAWNSYDAVGMANCCADECTFIAFDGTQYFFRKELEQAVATIFKDHQPPRYVHKIREISFFSPEVAQVFAIVGMLRNGDSSVDPSLNAIQLATLRKKGKEWRVISFQNTPARFDQNPELVEEMTQELNTLARRGG